MIHKHLTFCDAVSMRFASLAQFEIHSMIMEKAKNKAVDYFYSAGKKCIMSDAKFNLNYEDFKLISKFIFFECESIYLYGSNFEYFLGSYIETESNNRHCKGGGVQEYNFAFNSIEINFDVIFHKETYSANRLVLTNLSAISKETLYSVLSLKLPNLEYLEISKCHTLSPLDLSELLLHFKFLKDLNISSLDLKQIQTKNVSLERLIISEIHLSNEDIANISQINSLTTLNLGHCGLSAKHLTHLVNLNNLRHLFLDNNKLTDFTALKSVFKKMNSRLLLESLSIDNLNIKQLKSETGVSSLIAKSFPNLKCFSLSRVFYRPDCLISTIIKRYPLNLNGFSSLSKLTELRLTKIFPGFNDLRGLFELVGKLPSLKILKLSGSLSYDFIFALCQQSITLEKIIIEKNQLIKYLVVNIPLREACEAKGIQLNFVLKINPCMNI